MISCDFALIFASPSDSTRAGSVAERCKRAVFSVSIRCLLDAQNQTTALSETPHACPSPSSSLALKQGFALIPVTGCRLPRDRSLR
eukprot:515290-Pleurochrysis_carterae.AAC.1